MRMMEPAGYPPVIVVAGPTAVGKSALALDLAVRFRGAIVTADSRQVYRYMDIGTDKPGREERARAEHFMIDLVAPDDPYSVQRFRHEGEAVLRRLAAEGRVAIVAGGTGFYMRALLDRPALPDVPPDPPFRTELLEEAARIGSEALHARLKQIDRASAERIHPNNVPRLVRALEITRALGGPVPRDAADQALPALYIGLTMNRDALKARADARIDEQMAAGLADETEKLLAMGYSPELPALQGFGYRQMAAYLRGERTREAAVEEYRIATRQYIRRQMTWFRQDQRMTWLDAGADARKRAGQLVEDYLATVSGPSSGQAPLSG